MGRKEELLELIKESFLELSGYDETVYLSIVNLDNTDDSSEEFVMAHATIEELASYGFYFLLEAIGRTAEKDGEELTHKEKLQALKTLVENQL